MGATRKRATDSRRRRATLLNYSIPGAGSAPHRESLFRLIRGTRFYGSIHKCDILCDVTEMAVLALRDNHLHIVGPCGEADSS